MRSPGEERCAACRLNRTIPHLEDPDNRAYWRDIELAEDQTMEDLHLAIQDACGWGNYHLFAFLTRDGRVKVLDFRLAKVISDAPATVEANTALEDPFVFISGIDRRSNECWAYPIRQAFGQGC